MQIYHENRGYPAGGHYARVWIRQPPKYGCTSVKRAYVFDDGDEIAGVCRAGSENCGHGASEQAAGIAMCSYAVACVTEQQFGGSLTYLDAGNVW